MNSPSGRVPQADTTPSGTPLLQLRQVSRHYDDGAVQALNGVSLNIAKQEYVAIMGPSGSGKSTLLNIMGGLDRPTSGEVWFDGQCLNDLRQLDAFRSQQLGFVFQSFHLLPTLTALENVQIPMLEGSLPARQRQERASALLDLVGLSHRRAQFPLKLSVGERQRVAIARALANEPQLLLADEPTGNLDSVAGHRVLELFDRLHQHQGMTLVVITHGIDVARRAQRLVWIQDGQLSERAKLEEEGA